MPIFSIKKLCLICTIPVASISTASIVISSANSKTYEQYIPKELLSLSQDETILYGFAPEVSIKQIARAHYKTLKIPEKVKVISNYAFAYMFDGLCCDVNSIILNENIEEIGSHAFARCTGIKSINFMDLDSHADLKLTHLGNAAFYRTGIANRLIIPHSVQFIGDNCFNYCEDLTEIKFNSSLVSVGTRAFAYCNHIRQVDLSMYPSIPNWLFNINSIFQDIGLREQRTRKIIIDTTINDLNEWSDCLINRQNLPTDDSGFIFEEINQTTPEKIFEITSKDKDFILTGINIEPEELQKNYYLLKIPSKVTKIEKSAFEDVFKKENGIIRLELNENLTNIGGSAFNGCDAITGDVILPSTLTDLGNKAFYETGISYVEMDSNLVNIGTQAFASNPSLERAIISCIPDSEENEEEKSDWGDGKTFRDCPKLWNIDLMEFNEDLPEALGKLTGDKAIISPDEVSKTGIIDVANTLWINKIASSDGWNFNCFSPTDPAAKWTRRELAPPCMEPYVKTNSILNKVVLGLTDEGLDGRDEFSAIDMPFEAEVIANSAFKNVFKRDLFITYPWFWQVNLNKGLRWIENDAFYECTGLSQKLQFPSTLEHIGNNAFFNCLSFRGDLVLPNSLNFIGDNAFMGCHFSGVLNLPTGGIDIGSFAFTGNYFDTVVFPKGHISLGSCIFTQNTLLKTIDLSILTFEEIKNDWDFQPDSFYIQGSSTSEPNSVYVSNTAEQEDWDKLLYDQMGLPRESWQVVIKE